MSIISGRRIKRKPPKSTATKEKPSKDEYAIAGYMRQHVPRKRTKFLDHPVEYFTAARAVNALMDSPWATGVGGQQMFFTDRESVVMFLDLMLRHKFFHRAKKIVISERDLRRKQIKKMKRLEEEERGNAPAIDDDSESEEDDVKLADRSNEEDAGGEPSAKEGDVASKASARKPKRRIKLDMHLEQTFVDGLDAYVWLYDPIPTHYWLLGALIVATIVTVCLFPLWPGWMRRGVYYLAVAAVGFLMLVLVLSVVRAVVFLLLWLPTRGRLQLWLLPNLLADVGFFASFWPLYQYEYKSIADESPQDMAKKKKHVQVSCANDGPEVCQDEDIAQEQQCSANDAADKCEATENPAAADGSGSKDSL